jgi:hypothetical protein
MQGAGLLAHPVERFHGMEEVSGSSPLESTFADNKTTPLSKGVVLLSSKQIILLAAKVESAAMFFFY